MTGSDFVQVRLTEFGRNLCGSSEINVISGQHEFTFTRDQVQRVTKAFDWVKVLQPQIVDGHELFEVIEDESSQIQSEVLQQIQS